MKPITGWRISPAITMRFCPMTTRADLPPPWPSSCSGTCRRTPPASSIFSRFLTDSENLNKILRITLATYALDGGEASEASSRRARRWTRPWRCGCVPPGRGLAADRRVRRHRQGNRAPHPVGPRRRARHRAAQGLGYPRSKFEELLSMLRNGEAQLIRADRKIEELQAIFDGLSFNKARIPPHLLGLVRAQGGALRAAQLSLANSAACASPGGLPVFLQIRARTARHHGQQEAVDRACRSDCRRLCRPQYCAAVRLAEAHRRRASCAGPDRRRRRGRTKEDGRR